MKIRDFPSVLYVGAFCLIAIPAIAAIALSERTYRWIGVIIFMSVGALVGEALLSYGVLHGAGPCGC